MKNHTKALHYLYQLETTRANGENYSPFPYMDSREHTLRIWGMLKKFARSVYIWILVTREFCFFNTAKFTPNLTLNFLRIVVSPYLKFDKEGEIFLRCFFDQGRDIFIQHWLNLYRIDCLPKKYKVAHFLCRSKEDINIWWIWFWPCHFTWNTTLFKWPSSDLL